jgi:hypothetical protein
MRSMKQVVVALATGGLLVAGGTVAGIALTQGTARADNVGFCLASPGTGSQCQLDDVVIPDPSDIYVALATPSNTKGLDGTLTWSVSCPSTAAAQSGSQFAVVPSSAYILKGISIAGTASCTATVDIRIVNFSADTQSVSLSLNYDAGTGTGTGTTATPTPTQSSSVPSGGVTGVIKGFDGKCVNDTGNSSKLGAPIVSYVCGSAKGKTWRYAQGELIHNGLCLNDKGNAGNGGKLILYTCNGSPDEIWVYNSLKDIFQLRAHSFTLCVTIPNSSKKNGIQLQANTCHNGANQHWTMP